jgi:hypothetical protein
MDTGNRPKANAENSRTHTGSASGCCGGPAPAGTDACCVRDAAVKSSGGSGCGCERGTTNCRAARNRGDGAEDPVSDEIPTVREEPSRGLPSRRVRLARTLRLRRRRTMRPLP